MVGIAGGVPASSSEIDNCDDNGSIEDHVRLGDAVISADGIFQYDMIKKNMGDAVEFRANEKRPSPILKHLCNDLCKNMKVVEASLADVVTKIENDGVMKRPKLETDILQAFELETDVGTGIQNPKAVRSFLHPKQHRRNDNDPIIHVGKIGSANILLKDPCVRDELRTEHKLSAVEMEGSGVADAAWSFDKGFMAIRGICDYCDPNKNDDWQIYASYVAAGTFFVFVELYGEKVT